MKTKGTWCCPKCDAKNSNLKRHYRSIADLCIISLLVTGILLLTGFNKRGIDLGLITLSAHAMLLLVTIIFVYKSKSPWMDEAAKTLIWVVFGMALLLNVVVPLFTVRILNIPAAVIYAIVFPYLFWLHSQARKCTVTEP